MVIALLSYLEWKKTFPKLRLLKRRLLIWLSEKEELFVTSPIVNIFGIRVEQIGAY
jgi:hypothetical protein